MCVKSSVHVFFGLFRSGIWLFVDVSQMIHEFISLELFIFLLTKFFQKFNYLETIFLTRKQQHKSEVIKY